MLWIEFQRLVTSLFGALPPPPFDIAFRLSLRIFLVSVRVGALSILFLFCFYFIFWHVSPPLPLAACLVHVSMRVGALAPGWSVLFCFVLFLLVRTPVPPSGRLPAPLHREAGGARIPIFIFVLYFIFSPRIACRGERRAPLFF